MTDLMILLASAAVVGLMVAVAGLLNFRKTLRLDADALAQLAAAEGCRVEASAIAPDARQALARLSGDKVLGARVMADGVSARVAPAHAAQLRINGARVRMTFADLGFPPLELSFAGAPPTWVVELARGAAK